MRLKIKKLKGIKENINVFSYWEDKYVKLNHAEKWHRYNLVTVASSYIVHISVMLFQSSTKGSKPFSWSFEPLMLLNF